MAIRQYIGARYVPRFMGAYDPTQSYEALDVVDNGSGTSYIARKTVPAGTPLTDNSYWFLYGASSGAIVQLQNDMIAAQGDILNIQLDVSMLQGSMLTVKNKANDAYDLASKLSAKEKPNKIMFITDSYGNQVDDSNLRLDEIVAQKLNIPTNLISVSGGSMRSGTINAAVNNYSGAVDYDMIVVVAGANDQSNTDLSTSIISGVETLVSTIKTKFGTNNIIITCPGLTFGNGVYDTASRIRTARSYKAGATNSGVKYLDNSQYILCNTKYLKSDFCHPNNDGLHFLAEKIVEGIINGSIDVIIQLNTENNAGSQLWYMIRHNGSVIVNRQGGNTVTISTSAITMGSSEQTIDTLKDTLIDVSGNLAANYISMYGYCTVGGVEERAQASVTIKGKNITGFFNSKSGPGTNATNLRLFGQLIFND